MDSQLFTSAANTVRCLAADGVQKAKSGHPGMPMGCADYAFVLWHKHMRHNPKNPSWVGRDRFILSAGHGSMLLYSMLHLFEYGVTTKDLESFRQWESVTPGHPELGETPGVEVTTGPLGSGFATAVGMAIAAKNFAARAGLEDSGLFDNKFYVLSSDGCMMEGTTHEAAALAGHLKLDNIVCFYDDNSITIEGSTELAFSEDVGARFAAYNWRVIKVDNANDVEKVDRALAKARKSDGRPTMIVGKTKIGFGSPKFAGKEDSHGAPLGDDEVLATKSNLGLPGDKFHVPAAVAELCRQRVAALAKEAAEWEEKYKNYLDQNPAKAELVGKLLGKHVPEDLLEQLVQAAPVEKATATRVSGGVVLQKAAALVPSLIGGAADLAPSTKTLINGEPGFSADNRAGRNLHFGVRELGMGMCGNGIAIHGAAIPYVSTFFVFADYMKPAIRLAAIQKLSVIYVFTHDSFYVGEDGPTHEPIEQIAMMRSIPGMTVIRPAEAREAAHAWAAAIKSQGPVALLMTRQDLQALPQDMAARIDLAKGAYVLSDDANFETIIIATGSEVNLALAAAAQLRGEGAKIRVVSMPSWELFDRQSAEYRESVLPAACRRRVSIEAASTFGWHRFVGDAGLPIGIDHFGASAPYKVLAEKYGFTTEAVVAKIKAHFA